MRAPDARATTCQEAQRQRLTAQAPVMTVAKVQAAAAGSLATAARVRTQTSARRATATRTRTTAAQIRAGAAPLESAARTGGRTAWGEGGADGGARDAGGAKDLWPGRCCAAWVTARECWERYGGRAGLGLGLTRSRVAAGRVLADDDHKCGRVGPPRDPVHGGDHGGDHARGPREGPSW